MFAPQTLQFRYGDDGLLGQAAAGVGQGDAYLRNLAMQRQQQQLDMQSVNEGLNRQEQAREFNVEQANRLQMANALNTKAQSPAQPDFYSMGTSPTSGNYFTKSSPIVQAVRTAKQQAVANAVGSAPLSDSDRANLQTLASNDQMPFEQVRQLANDAASRAISAKNVEDSAAAKNVSATATQQRFDTQKQVQGIDTQIREAQRQADQLQKMTSLLNLDPASDPPAAFDKMPGGAAMYARWGALQSQLQNLQKQRESALAPSASPSPAQAANNGSISMVAATHSPPPGYQGTSTPPTQYQEGQVLHSPSTGRVFKVVNGQLTETTNAGT